MPPSRDQWIHDPINGYRRQILIAMGVIIVGLLAVGFFHITRVDVETPQQRVPPIVTKKFEDGFVQWEVTETDLGDTKRIEGLATWNEKSGIFGQPVVGMPVHLFRVDRQMKELVEIRRTFTDRRGRFEIYARESVPTRLAGLPEKAKNAPEKVKEALKDQNTWRGE